MIRFSLLLTLATLALATAGALAAPSGRKCRPKHPQVPSETTDLGEPTDLVPPAESTDTALPQSLSDASTTSTTVEAEQSTGVSSTEEGAFTGKATFYGIGGMNACGWTDNPEDYTAALNAPQYGNVANTHDGPSCGKCAMVTGPLGSLKVTITSLCPECQHGDLDLSESAFVLVANKVDGRVDITWSYVGC
ncbi:hypothetical protein H4R34_006158 [Dimargaris verticillata]|uniref:RlpA-like double-psi beta-barrel-protein domain-containing protein-containing protein n=1 Tax=Dimargaris verticillata TaxID=2761393 RepID=A0A9W8E926_9FUNG|nr:hypothetical protein H4R34_006158 [Dimargaris verticillata]